MPDQGMIVIIGLLVLAVVVAIVLPMSQKAARAAAIDPFVGYSGIEQIDNAQRDEYIAKSAQRYNMLSETDDVTRGGFVGTTNPISIQRADDDVQAATRTSFMEADSAVGTRQGVRSERMPLGVVGGSPVLNVSNKCEELKGRASCARLGTPGYENCGICIKGGTTYRDPDNADKHIGGLVVLPEDRRLAEESAEGSGEPVQYFPSVGSCPEGYFFVSRSECEKGVNRQDCKEAGETGGFNNGRNIEGAVVGPVKCAQVPVAGNNAFIYDPKNRRFNINLRVLTPVGTGICKVIVTNQSGTQVGYAMVDTPGKDFTVTVLNVTEGDRLNVRIIEEVPYRAGGKQEVFYYAANPNGLSWPRSDGGFYGSSQEARTVCERIGTSQATETQLRTMQQLGGQNCQQAWANGFLGYPSQGYQKDGICGTGSGLQISKLGRGAAWCYGVKPPNSTNNFFITSAGWWFNPYKDMEPSQADIPAQWSQHGDYQAPSQRAVLIQWESLDGKRKVPFEQTVLAMNGLRAEGGAIKTLRRFGTFNGSRIIMQPRPASIPTMLTNMFWFWSNQSDSQQMTVEAQVPGTFMDPVYSEDLAIASAGPLVTKPETMELLKTGACLGPDEAPGRYTSECLISLFKSAGGDIYNGNLAKEGLEKLNSMGDMDTIGGYLSELYNLATKGKSTTGMRASATEINDAAQKMFGFDIVTPCEDVSEDASGKIILVPRVGGLDSECLDYLWQNTGNDRSRGYEDLSRRTFLKNTYTFIGDRFSGLRSNEGTKAARAAKPFAACQKSGTMAPISDTGKENISAIAVANSKGNIDMIQRFYDGIHKAANYSGNNADMKAIHTKAIEQCYGLKPAKEEAPPSCGVRARFVRVLRSHIAANSISQAINGPNEPSQPNIQIPQIQVFGSDGKELARGKPVSNATECCGGNPRFANNGDARPKTHGEGEYHDDAGGPQGQFWMVDLGGEFEIQKIVYYLRTDCCTGRQVGTPIQLLNSSRQIVAEKNLGHETAFNGQFAPHIPQVLLFSGDDLRPKIPRDALIPAQRLTLFSGTGIKMTMTHFNFAIFANTTLDSASRVFKENATWIIRPANNGRPGFISFESVNYPSSFLRHAGFRCWLHRRDGSGLFNDDSTFRVIPALNGDPTMVSFESSNFPGHFICTELNRAREVWIGRIDSSSPYDALRACWRADKAMA